MLGQGSPASPERSRPDVLLGEPALSALRPRPSLLLVLGPRLLLLSMMFCSRVWGSWATAWSRYWRSLLMLDTGMPKDCTKSNSCWGSRSCRAEGDARSVIGHL